MIRILMRIMLVMATGALLVGITAAQDDSTAEISVVKSVSSDGGTTWHDAQIAPGLIVSAGDPLSYLIQIANTGDETVTGLSLVDTLLDASTCTLPESLEPDELTECVLGPIAAADGQTVNTVLVTAQANGTTLTATDSAYAFAGSIALVRIEKLVGVGGAWFSADNEPGLAVTTESEVQFRIIVTNDGTETLTDIVLSDSMVSLESCVIPAELPPGLSFECVVGPISPEDEGQQVNIATVTAMAGDTPVTASDEAHFVVSEADDDIVIIIEGPIEAIDGNIIIIFGISIELDPDDPMLTVIRIGDIVRIDGTSGDGGIIIAVIIIVVDVDIYIGDFPDDVYRDDGECGNPPPPWAPAHGWRRKCQGVSVTPGALPPGLRKKFK
ncbi:MAG: hypothetical protein IPM16_21525 [Chloroflexi bacterium]|nr:hypothetical protein [Chloroflexota bacterium]